MAKFVSVFISPAYRRFIALLAWTLTFLVAMGFAGSIALQQTSETMEAEAGIVAEHFVRLRENLVSTFDVMHETVTAAPCTPAFAEQLRRVAYLPDGLNEFLYAPGGRAQCSTRIDRFEQPIELGHADFVVSGATGIKLWIDQDLTFVGLSGERGSIALSEPFATVVPHQQVDLGSPDWLSLQVILRSGDAAWWHRSGVEGIYDRILDPQAGGVLSGRLATLVCDENGPHCIAAEADLPVLLGANLDLVAVAALLAVLVASGVTRFTNGMIASYWSFEARFRRHLDAGSIVCAYQPVMELETGEINGCEVLARWRDVDDRIVFPDRFIDIVERNGMTLRFTELVAQRAFEELSATLPEGKRLQVNFNIFPRDLDSDRLARIFSCFASQPERFEVVLEIIESDQIPPNAQREIERLRRLGIRTYIDDFGTGYSNMQNLAALSVDGVKLDRAFAMAPDNSMMARMLSHAVEMIHATGRVMVVEGVETAERLALLREMSARIDYVQGYFISRPLDIAAFVAFLTPEPVSLAERKKKAGLEVVAA
ncbi:EAL domain-containing protein [Mesorhizobium sp. CAU 1741]|uniref:EAL domain-containing protein n=1 Tax=Mesorhizobium sp. CAU 1741 TaxID=3140366 RepID=UPI00325BB713